MSGMHLQKWLTEAEKNLTMIKREFSVLNVGQLTRTVHIHECTISEMLINLILLNDRLIGIIEKALIRAKPDNNSEYHPGLAGMLLMRLSRKTRCHAGKFSVQGPALFRRLQFQQQKIIELITICMRINPNNRIIPFGPVGIFRISIGNAMEYLLLCQKNYLIMARQILMLQNL